MAKEFNFIRKQLEDHLFAINENTSEIQALLDYLREVEVKVEKVSQRMDLLQLQDNRHNCKPAVEPLTQIEKKIFLTLYTEENPLTFPEIAEKSGLVPSLIPDYISSIVHKGVPLQRSSFNSRLFFKLEPKFKELQAKENIINLSLQSFL
ncbi:MAG TPA: hypothetical protein VJH68_01490 [Candidatus Nanoarchaeia archaeon]|nr:hypothetical protein [Candidatus Nanoarchaeia archaeon]